MNLVFQLNNAKELRSKAGNYQASFKNSATSDFEQDVDYNSKHNLELSVYTDFIINEKHSLGFKAGSTIYNDDRNAYQVNVSYSYKF